VRFSPALISFSNIRASALDEQTRADAGREGDGSRKGFATAHGLRSRG
jgi:hypothetical protein